MYDFSRQRPELHPDTFIAEGVRIIGSPAKVARALNADEIAHHPVHAADYVAFWKAYVEKGIGKF